MAFLQKANDNRCEQVVGFIHYHNTITIPNDESWIVQGMVDPVSGLPASLNARFSSGNAFSRSHASIVLRQLRISNQKAPIDPNAGSDPFSPGEAGGAFRYEGGSSDPSKLAKIIFVEVIFDHNSAAGDLDKMNIHLTGGGAVWIDGRAAFFTTDPEEKNLESGIELTIQGCTFFANFAATQAFCAMVSDSVPR